MTDFSPEFYTLRDDVLEYLTAADIVEILPESTLPEEQQAITGAVSKTRSGMIGEALQERIQTGLDEFKLQLDESKDYLRRAKKFGSSSITQPGVAEENEFAPFSLRVNEVSRLDKDLVGKRNYAEFCRHLFGSDADPSKSTWPNSARGKVAKLLSSQPEELEKLSPKIKVIASDEPHRIKGITFLDGTLSEEEVVGANLYNTGVVAAKALLRTIRAVTKPQPKQDRS